MRVGREGLHELTRSQETMLAQNCQPQRATHSYRALVLVVAALGAVAWF